MSATNSFEVGLSFHGIPERLVVPFDAIKGFFDPSVQFGLQFETVTEAQALPAKAANELQAGKTGGGGDRQSSRPTPRGAASEPEERPATPSPAPRGKKNRPPPSTRRQSQPLTKAAGAEVVSLDKFRKK